MPEPTILSLPPTDMSDTTRDLSVLLSEGERVVCNLCGLSIGLIRHELAIGPFVMCARCNELYQTARMGYAEYRAVTP